MQALFIMGLFSSIYMVIAVMISSSTDSVMIIHEKRVDRVNEIFVDVRDAIHDGYLANNPDFTEFNSSRPEIDEAGFIMPYLSWSSEELKTDPWQGDITFRIAEKDHILHADGAGQSIRAPIYAILLFSNGIDGVNNSGALPVTYDDIRTFEAAADTDDIVLTFTTLEPAYLISNQIVNVFERIRATLIDDYRAQYAHFDDEVQAYYETQLATSGSSWDINNPSYSVGWLSDAGMMAQADYPSFTQLDQLGLSGEIAKLPKNIFNKTTPVTLTTNASSPSSTKPTWSDLTFHVVAGANDWAITMSRAIKASEILTE